jgi:hypothetical protein
MSDAAAIRRSAAFLAPMTGEGSQQDRRWCALRDGPSGCAGSNASCLWVIGERGCPWFVSAERIIALLDHCSSRSLLGRHERWWERRCRSLKDFWAIVCWSARCRAFASPHPVFRPECHCGTSDLALVSQHRACFNTSHSSMLRWIGYVRANHRQ